MTWTSTVDFPDRDRENSFVARLWATQRVGYLSAEKRKNGGSSEIDDEIRALGERYGIPTEFTSYLVTEPTGPFRAHGDDGRHGGVRPAWRPRNERREPVRWRASPAFESAKAASAQRTCRKWPRSTRLIARRQTSRTARQGRSGTRTVASTDGRSCCAMARGPTRAIMPECRSRAIKPYSKAYFDIVAAGPGAEGHLRARRSRGRSSGRRGRFEWTIRGVARADADGTSGAGPSVVIHRRR